MISRHLFTGRREGGRRDGEIDRIYVDRTGGWVIAGFFVLVGLSLLDAGFTLWLLDRGATEANPVMRAALHVGNPAFVAIKAVITVLAVGFLCLHKNWPLGRVCLVIALLGYSALTLYHLHAQRLVSGIGL